MNEAPSVDSVTGLIFNLLATFATLTAWYYHVRRLHAYSRYSASHKAQRRPMHAQLRLGTEDGRPAWLYSTTW